MRGPDEKSTMRARALRQTDNDAEAALWYELRNRRLNGFKFVRQLPIGPFFADFDCRHRRLVVEVDGSQHAHSTADADRDLFMINNGWNVARFWHICILNDRQSVLETLVGILDNRLGRVFSYGSERGLRENGSVSGAKSQEGCTCSVKAAGRSERYMRFSGIRASLSCPGGHGGPVPFQDFATPKWTIFTKSSDCCEFCR